MKNVVKYLLIISTLILTSCTTVNTTGPTSTEISDLRYWDTSKYFSAKFMGEVLIFTNEKMEQGITLRLVDKNKSDNKYFIGKFDLSRGYKIALMPGNYEIDVSDEPSLFKKGAIRKINIRIDGGRKINLNIVSDTISVVDETFEKPRNIEAGTIYFSREVENIVNPKIIIHSTSVTGAVATVKVGELNRYKNPEFIFNGEKISYTDVYNFMQRNFQYTFELNLKDGPNKFEANIVNIDGKIESVKFEYYKKSAKEVAQDVMKKQRQEEERIIKLENEKKAAIAERERIEREGDDSPDDKSCKRYGLKPQTQGYAECRMRLDLSRKEDQRQNKVLEQNRIQREQNELNAANANDALISKCQFVKASEYLKPTLGGFFESMQRANSAYENCMNGVPTINTTCSKDAFGNINCNSR